MVLEKIQAESKRVALTPEIVKKHLKDDVAEFVVIDIPRKVNTKYGERWTVTVTDGEQDYIWFMNISSFNALIDELGSEEKEWLGNIVQLTIVRQKTPKGLSDVIYAKSALKPQ